MKPSPAQLEALRLAPLRKGAAGAYSTQEGSHRVVSHGTLAACVRKEWLAPVNQGERQEWHLTSYGVLAREMGSR